MHSWALHIFSRLLAVVTFLLVAAIITFRCYDHDWAFWYVAMPIGAVNVAASWLALRGACFSSRRFISLAGPLPLAGRLGIRRALARSTRVVRR